MTEPAPPLSELLETHRQALVRFLAREASGLSRYETAEDLAQGVHLRVLKVQELLEWRGEAAFMAWLFKIARQHVADRHAYWSALKRSAGRLMRISAGGEDASSTGFDPPASMTGPATFADRRDQMRLAMAALDTLRPRDRDIIRLSVRGETLQEIAEALEIAYDAAQQARARAFDRFRRAFEVLVQTRPGPAS